MIGHAELPRHFRAEIAQHNQPLLWPVLTRTCLAGFERAMTKTQTAAILTLAENDHARIVTLSKSNAATVSDLEKSAEQLDVARAGISRSEAALAEAQQQVLVAESTLAYHEDGEFRW